MNDNPDTASIPALAEEKESSKPSHQVLALKKEITDFAGSYSSLVERIYEQETEIANLKKALAQTNQVISSYQSNLDRSTELYLINEREKAKMFDEILALPDTIHKKDILQIFYDSTTRTREEQKHL